MVHEIFKNFQNYNLNLLIKVYPNERNSAIAIKEKRIENGEIVGEIIS